MRFLAARAEAGLAQRTHPREAANGPLGINKIQYVIVSSLLTVFDNPRCSPLAPSNVLKILRMVYWATSAKLFENLSLAGVFSCQMIAQDTFRMIRVWHLRSHRLWLCAEICTPLSYEVRDKCNSLNSSPKNRNLWRKSPASFVSAVAKKICLDPPIASWRR